MDLNKRGFNANSQHAYNNHRLDFNCNVNFFTELDNHYANKYQNTMDKDSQPNLDLVKINEKKEMGNSNFKNSIELLQADVHQSRGTIIEKEDETKKIKDTERTLLRMRSTKKLENSNKKFFNLCCYNNDYHFEATEIDELLEKMVAHIKNVWSTLINFGNKLELIGHLTDKQKIDIQKKYNEEYLPLKNYHIEGGKKLQMILNSLPKLSSKLCNITPNFTNKSNVIGVETFLSEIHNESSTELSDEKEAEVEKLMNFENVDIQSDLYLSDDENECTDNEGQNNDFVKSAETLQRSSNSLPELCSKICNVTPNFKNKSNVIDVETFLSEIHNESSTELTDEKEAEVGKLRNFENVDIQSDLYLSDDENECTDNEGQNNDFVKGAETLQRSSNSLPELCSKICNVTPNFKNKSNVIGVETFHSEIQNKSITESNEQNPCSQNKLHIEENDFILNASEIIDPLPNLSMTALEKSTNSVGEFITSPKLDMWKSKTLSSPVIVNPILRETNTDGKIIKASESNYFYDGRSESEELNHKNLVENALSTEIETEDGKLMNFENVDIQNDLYLSDDGKMCTEIDVQNKDSFKSKEFLEMKFKDSSIGIRNSLHDSVKKSRTTYIEADDKNKDFASNFCLMTSLPSNKDKMNDNCCNEDILKNLVVRKQRARKTFSKGQKHIISIERDSHSNLSIDKNSEINYLNANESEISDVSKNQKPDINKVENSLISELSNCDSSFKPLCESEQSSFRKEKNTCIMDSQCSNESNDLSQNIFLSENNMFSINELISVPKKSVPRRTSDLELNKSISSFSNNWEPELNSDTNKHKSSMEGNSFSQIVPEKTLKNNAWEKNTILCSRNVLPFNDNSSVTANANQNWEFSKSQDFENELEICHEDSSEDSSESHINNHNLDSEKSPSGKRKRTESSSLQEENMVLEKIKNIPCKSNFAEKCLPNKRSTMLLPGPSAPNNWKKSSIINRNISNVHKSFCAEEKVSTLCNSKLLKIPITVKKNQLKRKLKIVDSETSSVAPVRIRGRTAQSKICKKSVSQLDDINETIKNLNSESREAIFVDHADNIKNYQSIKPAKMRKEHKRKDHRKAEPLFNDKDHHKAEPLFNDKQQTVHSKEVLVPVSKLLEEIPDISKSTTKPTFAVSVKKMSIFQDLNKIAKCTDKQLIIKEDVKKIRDEKVVERSAVSSQSSSCNISDKQYLSLKNSQSLNEKSLKIQGSLSLNLASKKGRNLPEETVSLSSMIPDVTSEFVNKPSALTSIKKSSSEIQVLSKMTKCTDVQLIKKEEVKKINDKIVEKSAVLSQSSSCKNFQSGIKKSLKVPKSSSLSSRERRNASYFWRIKKKNFNRNNRNAAINISNVLNGVEDAQVGDLNFKCFVNSLTNFFINPENCPNISTLIFLIVNYLSACRKISLFDFTEGQAPKVFLPMDESCIVASLFKIEKKAKTHLQDLIKLLLSNMYQLILIKKNLSVLGLASLCRVFTEICKCIGDRFKPLTLCCDLLKEKSLLAPICIASIVGVWKKMFEISDDSTDEDLLLLSCIAYGAKKKTKKISDSFWDCSYKLLLEYSTIPSIPNTKIAIEHLKNEILSLCTKKSFEKSWQLTSSLLIIAAHEPLDFLEKDLVDEFIVPNLLKFSNQDSHEEAFNLFCNLYVDVNLLNTNKPADEVLIEYVCKGSGYIQDCAAAALMKYLFLININKKCDVPAPLQDWLEKNQDNPKVEDLENLMHRKYRSSNKGMITIKDIVIS
ncbi:uncharacterized protein CDAR_462222 [Caerostris darwini]|uniref:Telomere-associated protein RIF1 n=1 Tax=Caerostris darwini TaxID=1538125 RepID=A0AAV4R7T6_9ARAC|nr:uncharacterized protein CDAR_462222 [Caerostris darwini]